MDIYEEPDVLMVVSEHMKGETLYDKVVNDEFSFREAEVREIIGVVAEALAYCRSKGVVHRNIKPENILFHEMDNGKRIIKLVDFELSKQLDKDAMTFSILETYCGTPAYIAPEVVSTVPYNYKCDVWSLGVITFLLLSGGYLPFFVDPDKTTRDLLRRVRDAQWTFSPANSWSSVSDEAKDLLSNMLVREPGARFSYEQILGHKWFRIPSDSAL